MSPSGPALALVADVLTPADLLRLLAVPVLGWAAYRDVVSRRVPNRTWLPLVGLGLAALALDAAAAWGTLYRWDVLVHATLLSLGFVVPIAYVLWRLGGFGGADAKALMVLALLFPTYPVLYGPGFALPLVESAAGLFSLTILTNGVIVGAAYPLALAARNALRGSVGAHAFVGVPVDVEDLTTAHGRLLETPSGFGRSGLDLDALRMYCRWRGVSLADLRERPGLRDPATLPEEPDVATDGAVDTDLDPVDRGAGADAPDGPDAAAATIDVDSADAGPTDAADAATTATDADGATTDADGTAADHDDPWGAERFLQDIDHGAYGTTPEQLRDGLDLLVERETVWISPGIPFLVPIFVGLLLALTYGDLLVGIIEALGG